MAPHKQLTTGEKSGVVDASKVELATEATRYEAWLRLGSFAEVAREAGCSAAAIKQMADRHDWRARKLEHLRKLGLTRAAAASEQTLATLDAVSEVIAAETAKWNEPPEDGDDRMARAGGVVSVVDRLAKVQREALADLPPEHVTVLPLDRLSDTQCSLWFAGEEMRRALEASEPGKPLAIEPGDATAIVALLQSDVGREFLRAFHDQHGRHGSLSLALLRAPGPKGDAP